eukprot:TRINITY_DN11125_c1_g1_i3.p1 TRINITY_DN11125_c1_g1~~TRINITY_DN11125_c1_g1_i3.p1  ORF type:complete len:211 (+),score=33.59 TRINITY_DN11125_c1_g1_i3:375-1007(+)
MPDQKRLPKIVTFDFNVTGLAPAGGRVVVLDAGSVPLLGMNMLGYVYQSWLYTPSEFLIFDGSVTVDPAVAAWNLSLDLATWQTLVLNKAPAGMTPYAVRSTTDLGVRLELRLELVRQMRAATVDDCADNNQGACDRLRQLHRCVSDPSEDCVRQFTQSHFAYNLYLAINPLDYVFQLKQNKLDACLAGDDECCFFLRLWTRCARGIMTV